MAGTFSSRPQPSPSAGGVTGFVCHLPDEILSIVLACANLNERTADELASTGEGATTGSTTGLTASLLNPHPFGGDPAPNWACGWAWACPIGYGSYLAGSVAMAGLETGSGTGAGRWGKAAEASKGLRSSASKWCPMFAGVDRDGGPRSSTPPNPDPKRAPPPPRADPGRWRWLESDRIPAADVPQISGGLTDRPGAEGMEPPWKSFSVIVDPVKDFFFNIFVRGS